jgi:drug/metabolite transporter (DMT)-like permease
MRYPLKNVRWGQAVVAGDRVSPSVFAVVMLAALLHASWNAIVKAAPDKLLTTIMVTTASAGLAAALIPFLKAPASSSFPYAMASALLQIIYFLLVARTYHVADMSQAYPLMRGTAPLIVAIVSALKMEEALSAIAWVGVLVICLGILIMALGGTLKDRRGMRLAFLNALVIAGYTLIDGLGVRKSGAPAAYTLWVFLLAGAPLAVWVISMRRATFVSYIGRHWALGLAGGAGTTASYGLALWAMTIAPIALVAALRETSILFAALIAGFVLREPIGPRRVISACVIAGGAAILRLA